MSEAKLVDPGLVFSTSSSSSSDKNTTAATRSEYKFTIKATSGVAVWVWLDYPAGLVGRFDDNAFVLWKGEEKEIGFRIIEGEAKIGWEGKTTVRSLWDNYLP